MSGVLDDLLAALKSGARAAGPGEVVGNPDPASTRGTSDSRDAIGGCQGWTGKLYADHQDLPIPCAGCQWPDVCHADRVCWTVEGAAERRAFRPPLWVLRKPNGKPNYADAMEMERYLKEAGWLAWSVKSRAPEPESWESWIARQKDPRRLPPIERLVAVESSETDVEDAEPEQLELPVAA